MKFRPLFRILAPPDHSVVIFQYKFVSRFFSVRTIRSFHKRLFAISHLRIFNEKVLDGDFLTILEYQNKIIASPLVAGDIFRCQLQKNNGWTIQEYLLTIPGTATRTVRLVNNLDIYEAIRDTTI